MSIIEEELHNERRQFGFRYVFEGSGERVYSHRGVSKAFRFPIGALIPFRNQEAKRKTDRRISSARKTRTLPNQLIDFVHDSFLDQTELERADILFYLSYTRKSRNWYMVFTFCP
uniref:Uncharacterized protein n=1 Tax=Candidatus Kentrum sp. TC TaxID=2126339 RepID=A0A450YJF8_9GAMM|nr:MAG: hypothetical protein BECKTC1821E_GA0114239_10138 [Candidatus Kentron sp. TC]